MFKFLGKALTLTMQTSQKVWSSLKAMPQNTWRDIKMLRTKQGRFTIMNRIAHSKKYDLVGCAVVVIGCWFMGFFNETSAGTTAFKDGSFLGTMFGPHFLIGWVGVISALMSLLSDRFAARLSNLANWISLPSIVFSCYVDYCFGNSAAVLTYPVSAVLSVVAIKVWHDKGKYDVSHINKYVFGIGLIAVSMIAYEFSLWTNTIGFEAFHQSPSGAIFWTTVFAFAISLIANVAQMIKMPFNNGAWIVYNIVQLLKYLAEHQYANVFKYIYYFTNNFAALFSWSKEGRQASAVAEKKNKAFNAEPAKA